MSGFDGFPFPLNNYGKSSISRLPKKSFNTYTDSSISTKPSVLETSESSLKVNSQIKQTTNIFQVLTNVSDLSPSPVYQDVVGSKKPMAKKEVRQVEKKQQVQLIADNNSPNPMGLITNAFMSATTKYTKMKPQQNLRTPIKNIQAKQEQTPDNSKSSNKIAVNKFARKRVDNSNKVEKIQELVLNTNKQQIPSSQQILGTDRSSNFDGKKIERKAEKPKRQLKFHDKKDNKVEIDVQSQSSRQPSPQIHLKTNEKTTEQKSEATPANKQYQPIQRQNRALSKAEIPSNIINNDKISETLKKQVESSPIQQFDSKNKQSNISVVKPYQRIPSQSQKISTVQTPISATKLQDSKLNPKQEQKPQKMVESKIEGLITSSTLKPSEKLQSSGDKLLQSQSELSSSSVTPYPNLKPTESIYESHIQSSVVRPYQRPQLKVPDIVNQILPSPISSSSSLSSRQKQSKPSPSQIRSQPQNTVKNSPFSQMQAILGGDSVVKSESIKQNQINTHSQVKPIARSRTPGTTQVNTPSKLAEHSPNIEAKIQETSKKGDDSSNKKIEQKIAPNRTPSQSFRSNNQQLNSSNVLAEQIKVTLKKSFLISFIIKRILQNQVYDSFKTIKQISLYYKVHASHKGKPLSLASQHVVKLKQMNLVRHFFQQMKKKFITPYISSLKGQVQWKQTNKTQVSFNMIDKLYLSKLRSIFNKLKAKKLLEINQSRAIDSLHTFQRSKNLFCIRKAFLSILYCSKQKFYFTSTFINIANSINKQKIAYAFISLLKTKKKEDNVGTPQKKKERPSLRQSVVASPQPQKQSQVEVVPNPLLLQKIQKLKSIITSVNDGLSILNKKYESLQAEKQHEKQQLKVRVDQLNQANKQMQGELQNKKNRHSVLEKQLTTIQTRAERRHQISDEIETEDTHLQLLTKIYIANFKNKEQYIIVDELWEQYQLNSYNNSAKTILQWQILQQNIQIKRIIASYEHLQMSTDFKARRVALAEQQIVTKLTKSYLKQQYFWEWLHLSAQTI